MSSISPKLPHDHHQNPPSASNSCIYASFCCRQMFHDTHVSNWIESYNPSINEWQFVTTIPTPIEQHVLKGFSMVSIGDSIYIIGGRLCRKVPGHDQDDQSEVGVEVLSSVLRYDVSTNDWSQCTSLGVPRFDFACTVSSIDNKIYVAGGKCTLDCPHGTSSAEVYDPALGEWKSLPEMRTKRYKCIGVMWQGKIHIIGGFAERGSNARTNINVLWHTFARSCAEVYDLEHNKWDLVVGMWQLDIPPNQIVNVDGSLFSSGDCLNAWKGHIEAYDGKLNIWKEVDGSHMNTLSSPISMSAATSLANWSPHQRLYLTMASIGPNLYFLAGYRNPRENMRSTAVVHVFDTSASEDKWKSFEPMDEKGEKELCSHCCVLSVKKNLGYF